MTDVPRGIRNCNPLNLRPGRIPWIGEVAPVDGYCVFITPFAGIRAGAKNMLGYQVLHGLSTVREIVTRWAPAEDQNNVDAYVNDVCQRTGFGPDDHLVLGGVDTLTRMVTAFIWHEQGQCPYSADEIQTAVMHALS